MSRLLFLIFFIHFTRLSFGQDSKEFESLRFNDDYSYLETDTSGSVYKRLKYTAIGKNTYHSIGGELRGQFFYIQNEDWGETGEPDDRYILHRYLLHSDLHLNRKVRTFIQLQGSFAYEKSFVSPVDQSSVEFHQAFVEYKNDGVMVRLGRQEFQYGSQRLVSVRELPNSRQSFDAINVGLKKNQNAVDFIYGHHVTSQPNSFDEQVGNAIKLWGVYGIKKDLRISNIDLYYLGLYKKTATFDSLSGREIRHSVGTRIWKSGERWKTDFEAVYQFGKVATNSINAYTISSNSSYTFTNLRLKPEIGLKTELISGNKSYSDKSIETFNPLFPKGAYFGLAALIGPANLIDLHPSVSLTLAEGLIYTFDYDGFWRYSTRDGIYTPSVMLIYSGAESNDRQIGHQFSTNIDWDPSKYVSLRLEVTWFKSGTFLRETGAGKDIVFTGVTSQIKF